LTPPESAVCCPADRRDSQRLLVYRNKSLLESSWERKDFGTRTSQESRSRRHMLWGTLRSKSSQKKKARARPTGRPRFSSHVTSASGLDRSGSLRDVETLRVGVDVRFGKEKNTPRPRSLHRAHRSACFSTGNVPADFEQLAPLVSPPVSWVGLACARFAHYRQTW